MVVLLIAVASALSFLASLIARPTLVAFLAPTPTTSVGIPNPDCALDSIGLAYAIDNSPPNWPNITFRTTEAEITIMDLKYYQATLVADLKVRNISDQALRVEAGYFGLIDGNDKESPGELAAFADRVSLEPVLLEPLEEAMGSVAFPTPYTARPKHLAFYVDGETISGLVDLRVAVSCLPCWQ